MRRYVSFLLAAALLSLAGCGVTETPAPGSPGAAPESGPAEGEAPRVMAYFDMVTDTVEREGAVMLTYSYPSAVVTTGTGSGAAISDAVNSALTPSRETLGQLSEAAWAEYASLDEAGREGWTGYGLYYTAEVTRGDGSVLSLYCTVSQNSGGVHPINGAFGLNFDVASGEALTAESISDDPAGLRAAVESFILGAAAESPEYGSFTGLEDFAAGALDGDEWYFGSNGLTVFASPMEIAPHAAGEITFSLAYSELAGLVSDEWIPDSDENGGAGAGSIEISEPGGEADYSAVLDEGGRSFTLTARDDLGPVSVHRVSMSEDGGTILTDEAFYISSLDAGESLGLTAAFMDMPLYAVSFGPGTTLLIADSGEDGSLLLLEP